MKNKKKPMAKAASGRGKVGIGNAKVAPKAKGKKQLSFKQRIILFSVMGALVLGALVGGFFGIRSLLGYGRDFDYLEADLSKYVTLSAEDLKNIKMTVRVDKPTEADVDAEILSLLVAYKTLAPGEPDPDAVIQNGSEVNLYYSGYILSENGDKEYFSGGSNLVSAAQDSAYTLVIGSGSFISGFEAGLCGIRPSDTEIPTVIKEGAISDGDVVYVNITGYHPNGKAITQSAKPLVLSPSLDEEYGKGFYELLKGVELTENACSSAITLESAREGEGTFVYTGIRPMYKTVGGKAHTVETYFPMNYSEANLQGKTAYFDVYVKDTTSFVLPEFTDAFLTDTAGVLPETLADYKGATLTEKYRSFLRQLLEDDYQVRLQEASEESFWKKIVEVAEVKRVPRAAWLEVYDEYMESLESTYKEYLSNMGYTEKVYSFDTFTKEYFKLSDGENYKDIVKENAKQTAGEKLIFFYAIELLDVAPSADVLSEASEKILEDLAKENSLLDESYYENKTDPEEKKAAYEEYVKELTSTKEKLKETLGEEYLRESAYYNHAFPKLLSLAKINYVGRGHS